MSSDWKTLTLSEIVDFGNGKARPKTEGNIPIYGGNGILGYSGDSNYQDETIIIGRVGAYCGATYFEINPIWVSDNALSAKAKEGFIAKYAYYVLKSKNLNQYAQGSSHPLLTQGLLNKLEAYVTTNLEVQEKIVSIIGEIEDKIGLNAQTNQTLEAIAQALFKSWFVDFDPVKAKIAVLESGGSAEDAELAAMNVISSKNLDELTELKQAKPEDYRTLSQTAALFPSSLQESELGSIPKGWNIEPLGDHLDVLQTGSRPKGGVGGIKEGVPSVGAENIIGVGNYKYGKEKFVSREFFDKLKRGVVEDFDFLLYKDGGKPGEFKPRVSMFGCGFPYSEFAINEHVFRMRSKSLGQAFLYFQIGHQRVLDELANRGGKAAIPGINQTDVKTVPIIIPDSLEVLSSFNKFALKVIESILKKSNESCRLADLRDALLPKLLSGEIDLSTLNEETSEVIA